MIIKPYSMLATEAFSASDFPCAKHFFPCTEAAGAMTLTDIAGGVVINLSSAITILDTNAVHIPATEQTSALGTWSVPGTKKVVAFVVGKYANGGTNYVRLGNSATGDSIKIQGNAGSLVVDAANSLANAGSVSLGAMTQVANSVVYGRAVVVSAYNSAGGATPYNFNTTDTMATGTGVSTAESGLGLGDQIDSLDQVTPSLQVNGNTSIYGLAWMEFTTLPSDLAVGLAWMTAQWALGNKAIYPAWKGLS